MVFDIASFQFRTREKLLICFLASSGLISAHFLIQGEVTGGALYALTFLRFLAAYSSKSPYWLTAFLVASIGACVVTYQSVYSLLALAGALASTYGAFQREDLRIRIFMLVGTTFWLVFNLVIFSPVAVARQVMFAVSNIVGLWRFHAHAKRIRTSSA